MKTKKIILKPGKEKAIRQRHHWIFSGAIAHYPEFVDGEILPVESAKGELLGSGYFNRKSGITGRMLAFDSTPPLEALESNLNQALALRASLLASEQTTAYRLVNAEGDRLPGLIIDKYEDIIVLQIGTLGMEKLRSWIVDYLIAKLSPKSIYEKSMLPSRKEEGLQPIQNVLYGAAVGEVLIKENGLKFIVPIVEGQKTGFFLDHRENRQWVRQLAHGKRVLNCFSYTGAFSIYALAGKARQVDSIDISSQAIDIAKRNAELNGFSNDVAGYFTDDVFEFLRNNPLDYDLIILDPPAFAKRQKDIIAACRGYKDINRIALQKMPKGSLLLSSSCSYHVNAELFQKVLFQAACEANRFVRIIGTHRLAIDHPINICHPEGDYLKSFLLYVE